MARKRIGVLCLGAAFVLAGCPALNKEAAEPELGPANPVALPTGQQITPTLPPFSSFASLQPLFPKHPNLAVGGAVTEIGRAHV